MTAGVKDSVQNESGRAAPASAIAQTVVDLERHLNLTDGIWQEDDIHWWPLYRLEIYHRLFLIMAIPENSGSGLPSLGPALNRAFTPKAMPDKGAIWLVSDGISFATLGELQVERFCDPLRMSCQTLGLPTVIIDRGSVKPRQSAAPMRWWAPWTQRAKIAGALGAKLSPDVRHEQRVRLVNAAAATAGVILPELNPHRFDSMARAVKGLAARLERHMRKELVRAVFVVGYYDVAGYAYVLAAARAGVPSIDVQHGVTGHYNLAYSSWPSIDGGWQLLPRWFWTWTGEDATVVQQWAGAQGPHHRAVCGGHPFLESWRAERLTLSPAMQDRLDELLVAAGNRRRVLVTLQPNLVDRESLGPLLWALRHCNDTAWWLRLHPMALQDRAAVLALLREQGTECYDIDTATALPLPALLVNATVHATHSSSTFIEAEAMGISSIVWSEYGAELAEDAVVRGVAMVALDGPAFQRQLNALANGVDRTQLQPTGSTVQALRTILEVTE